MLLCLPRRFHRYQSYCPRWPQQSHAYKLGIWPHPVCSNSFGMKHSPQLFPTLLSKLCLQLYTFVHKLKLCFCFVELWVLQFLPLLHPAHHPAVSRRVWPACLALWLSHVCGSAHSSAGTEHAGGLRLSARALQH